MRRSRAAPGSRKGLYCEGACGRPASSAACCEVQLRGGLVEEDARRRLHADRRLAADGAVGDAVQVGGEDVVLAVDFLVVERELGLDDLLPERALVAAQVEVAHQLHRDRRAALQRGAVGDVLDRRAEDAREVDAVVFVEALVLDRHRRVLERFAGISFQPTGVRSMSDWMKPSRVAV